jgi:hypothetical protein
VDLFNQIRKKLVIFVHFKDFNISQKPKSSPQSWYDGQIYLHWYKILGLLYKRALFNLQFVHNLFWLKLKWNAKSKLFYCIIYRSSIWSSMSVVPARLGIWFFSLVPLDNRNTRSTCPTSVFTGIGQTLMD